MFNRRHVQWPVEVSVQPPVGCDPADIERTLERLSVDNTDFAAAYCAEEKSIVIGGCGDDQLLHSLDLLKAVLTWRVEGSAPRVGYRETIRQSIEVNYTHNRMLGSDRQFVRLELTAEPLPDSFDFLFEYADARDAIPAEFIPAIERGISGVLDEGVLAGFPMIGIKVRLLGGTHDAERSTLQAYEAGARAAFLAATHEAGRILLEPMLDVEVAIPDEYLGDVIGDLNSRRGWIHDISIQDGAHRIVAAVPAETMLGYANWFKQMTGGRGAYTVAFSRYQRAPSFPDGEPPSSEPAAAALHA
jgi:elongation factor G